MSKKEIICVSTASYLPFPSRKQNVMSRLKDVEVLYIDPPVSYLAPLKDPKAKEKLKAYKAPGNRVRDNITVYTAPPVLPFFNKYRILNRLNQKRLAGYIRKLMKAHGFTEPLIWCYSPTSCDLVRHLPHKGLVYDCVDRHSAYPGHITPAVVDKMEEDLARQCDQVFCTAAGLYDTLIEYNEDTAMIPNGANYPLFSKAAEEPEEAPAEKRGPVFGFVGMLQECIDMDAMAAIAKAFPEGEIRILGRRLPGVDLSALEALDNVKFLGLVPQEELPALIREMDVCLNLFRGDRLSRDVSPLKFYEYLATGKPVVSTPEPGQVKEYKDIIYIGEGPDGIVEACGRALAELTGPEKERCKAARMAAGEACSWDSRVKQMEEILRNKGIF